MLPRLLLLTSLALCTSAAVAQPKGNPALPCFNALSSDPRFSAIKDKVALGGTMEELRRVPSSAERAGPQERPILDAWKGARDECRRLELPYYATRDAGVQALARDHFAAVQGLIAELQAGAMSYGEFGKRRVELYEKVNRDIEQLRQRILPAKPVPHTIEQK
jgi:hypothetical protein